MAKSYLRQLTVAGIPVFLLFLLALAGCTTSHKASPLQSGLEVFPKAVELSGVHNAFQLSSRIYSGGSPEGAVGFESLRKLGIKTIISVDGSTPDLGEAHQHGMRYVHMPHGYDGISAQVQAQLIKAATTVPGPIFVHCHHGNHRGPTAAAVICMGTEGWSAAMSKSWMKAAGTATNYMGLFGTVERFQMPSASTLRHVPKAFPETAKVSGLVDAMVAIDEKWDLLKAIRAAGYQSPKEHPDVRSVSEAVLLWEHFREAARLPKSVLRGNAFILQLNSAGEEVDAFRKQLEVFVITPSKSIRSKLDASFDQIASSCSACHKAFRNPPLQPLQH